MPALFIPTDGRLTSQNMLSLPLTGTEVMYIVSPGNAAQGNSYQVTLSFLASYFVTVPTLNPTILTAGTQYNSVATDTRILVDIVPPVVLTITMLPSSSYTQPVLIKDIAGNLNDVDTITIAFSFGQEADGQTEVVLSTPYAGIWLNPLVAGGFYITQA